MHEKDKEDVIRFEQNVHITQTFSKKETLKRPFSSLEGSITKLLTFGITSQSEFIPKLYFASKVFQEAQLFVAEIAVLVVYLKRMFS